MSRPLHGHTAVLLCCNVCSSCVNINPCLIDVCVGYLVQQGKGKGAFLFKTVTAGLILTEIVGKVGGFAV